MEAARAVSEEMAEIYLERNMQLQIPGWVSGACLGLDIRRVVETGITPLINTGIAHKEAGIGQIGARHRAGTTLACFEQALEALAESMGSWLRNASDDHPSSPAPAVRTELSPVGG